MQITLEKLGNNEKNSQNRDNNRTRRQGYYETRSLKEETGTDIIHRR